MRATHTSEPARSRAAAAAHVPRHTRLIRSARDGNLVSALTLPLLLLRPPSGFVVIMTTARKTGKARRKCVRSVRRGDGTYLVQLRPPELAMARPTAVAAWVWNIRANPSVKLRVRRVTFAGVAHEPPAVGIVRDGRLLLDCRGRTDAEADEVAAAVRATR
jgi:hypothetical protein